MVENIKELPAELEIKAFVETGVLQQSKIKIVQAGTVEKSPPGIPL